MFRSLLQRLPEPPVSGVVLASVAVFSLALLIIGLDSTILDFLLPSLPDQRGADDSALRWIERAKAIASWSETAAVGIGLGPLTGGLLLVVSTGKLATRSETQAPTLTSRTRAAETTSPFSS